jgi:hypothetical protein
MVAVSLVAIATRVLKPSQPDPLAMTVSSGWPSSCASTRAPTDFGEGFQRVAHHPRFVCDLCMAKALRSTVETADDPVVGFDHCVGQHRLPFRGAHSQDRKPPVLREITHAVGIIPLALPAQTSHPMGRNAGQQILGKIERCRYSSRSSSRLADEEFEPGSNWRSHTKRVTRSSAVSSSNASNCSRIDMAADWRSSSRSAARHRPEPRHKAARSWMSREGPCGCDGTRYEATGDILVRHRHLGFPEQPFLQLARTTSGEGAEAVEPP